MSEGHRLTWDWYPGTIPDTVEVHPEAYVETSYSFVLYRSRRPGGVTIGRGASAYLGTMFDVGPQGCVALGDYALVHGARIVSDAEILIGAYALISWNVVLMDTYRVPLARGARRQAVRRVAEASPRRLPDGAEARPIRIGANVWIGFDACVLPGVTIGEGAIVGARSVVRADVEPYTIVAGNPARVVRALTDEEIAHGR
jgi:acetyltransferase-like isoleucine patch superfamily enzyme